MTIIELGELPVSAATGGRTLAGACDLAGEPVVLLVHGAGMDRTFWSLQTRWLNHHGVTALAVDLPGHGRSPQPERASIVDYGHWLTDLVAGIDEGSPVHLVGHSMGSFIVLEAAAALGPDVGSITLVGTAADMGVHPLLLQAALDNPVRAAEFMSGWGYGAGTRNGPHPSPGSSMVGATVAMVAQADPGVLNRDLALCAEYGEAVERAGAFTGVASVLGGSEDRMTPPPKAQPIVDALTDPVVKVAAGVGHMIPVEAPALTRDTIAATVSRSGAAPAPPTAATTTA